jgi:tubulin polyglutamylase TTLL4
MTSSALEELSALFKSVPLPYDIITMPTEISPAVEPRSAGWGAHLVNGFSDCILTALLATGFRFYKGITAANIVVGVRLSIEDLQKTKVWSRVCHFSNVTLIGGKAELHFRMRELRKRLGREVSYYPLAFYPPDEYEELCEVWDKVPIWIVKAPALSRARAIRLTRPTDEPAPMLPYVVEQYIPRPLLITGRKFDIRLYALVTSVCPFTLYFHENGLALFATSPYDEVSDLADLTRHITNYEINRESEDFVVCDGVNEKIEDSKWSLPFLWEYFESRGIDWRRIKRDVYDVATSSIIASMCAVRNAHFVDVPRHRRCSYEFLGVDLLIDEDLKVWLLEINITPGMYPTSDLDVYVKRQVAFDLFNIIRIVDYTLDDTTPCREFARVERIMRYSLRSKRREAVVTGNLNPWDDPIFYDHMIIREFVDEQVRRRRFERAYPKRKTMDQYKKAFDKFTYEDLVLMSWVRMNRQERVSAITKKLEKHREEMKRTFPPPGQQSNCRVS